MSQRTTSRGDDPVSQLRISDVRFTASPFDEQKTSGLVGWISCVLDDRLQHGGISPRRNQDGHTTLAFPVRHNRTDRQVADIDTAIQEAILTCIVEINAKQLRKFRKLHEWSCQLLRFIDCCFTVEGAIKPIFLEY